MKKQMAISVNLAVLTIETPIGPVRMEAGDIGLTRIVLPGGREGSEGETSAAGTDHPLLADAARQINEYFSGHRTTFTLPLAPRGTPFQLRVWEIIRQIPYGHTMTYGVIASHLGNPGLARAVGGAAGANPLPLVIPCHRVMGKDGALTGFACGLALKERLLILEGSDPDPFA